MSSRRGHNEGSIYQRASDGLWVGSINLGFGPDGKRKRKPYYGKTRKEVADKMKAALHEQQQGILPANTGRQTVGQYLNDWLINSVKPTVRPKTYTSYKQLCDLYILPSLGPVQLSDLRPQQIRAFLNHVAQKKVKRTGAPMSARTVGYCHAVLRRSLNQAVKINLLPRNPATMIDTPRRSKSEARFLTIEQVRTFLASVKSDRLECLYTLAIQCGLRQGELLGLTWNCVDMEGGLLLVSQALQRIEGELRFVEPKSKTSKRTLALSQSAVASLRAHRIRQLEDRLLAGTQWKEHNLIFPNTEGGPYDAGNMVKVFHKALERAALPRINFHSLRHTCASLALSQGTHMKLVQDLLGHSDFYLTMNTYSHVVPELKRDVANRMDALFAASGE